MKNLLPATIVAKINNQSIVIINQNDEKRIAIRPICDAIGVDYAGQFTKLKTDEILSPVIEIISTTGADGKQYEMVTIPIKYVFGWLFGIHPNKVSEEARENLLRYKMECYDALWNHFAMHLEFNEEKNRMIEARLVVYKDIKDEFNSAKMRLKEADEELTVARRLTFDQWLADQRQQKIQFPEENAEIVNYANEGEEL